MANDFVFDYVAKLTEKAFNDKKLSAIDYVFGYAKLVLMDSAVLNTLFPEESDRAEIERIRSLFSSNKLDPNLIKCCYPLIRKGPGESDTAEEVGTLAKKVNKASVILAEILKANLSDLEMMKEGNSIDEVLKHADSDKSKEESLGKAKAPVKRTRKETKADLSESTKDLLPVEEKKTKPSVPDKEKLSELIDRTNNLYDCLKQLVFGQDEAVRLFAEGYFQSQVTNSADIKKKGPSATFLFAGPPGVGKTHLASSVASILNVPFKPFDMSEFSAEDTVQRLTGIADTFRSPKPGELTGFVKKNPECIILLDEIEKAHKDVIYQFLQILDGGRLTDACTREEIDFTKVILIFTTNVGKKLYEDSSYLYLSCLPRSVVMKEIENEVDDNNNKVFPAAICSRFASGNVIMLNRLGVHDFVKLIEKQFNREKTLIKDLYGYDLIIEDRVAPMLLFSQSTHMDARNMTSQASILIKNELYDLGRHASNRDKSLKSVDRIKMSVHVDKNVDPYVESLFVNRDKTVILYVGDPDEFPTQFSNTLSKLKIEIIYSDKDHVLEDIAENDISFVLINLKYDESDNIAGYLSLDDIKNDAVISFDLISEKLWDMPIYIAHKQDLRDTDMAVFLERGAREFIKWEDDALLIDRLAQISNMVYMQAKVYELSGRGRVLTYNKAQQIVGKEARIIFYDLKTEVAADAEEDKMLLSDDARPKDRFADVIGAENAKAELKFFVDYFKNPKKYMAQSMKPPKGILLYGPPGTGKTMLARAMAGESDVSFFPYAATSFLKKLVGESEESVRNLFKVAKKFAPSVIFIDEIDAIGKKRTGSTSTHHTESLLNALLTEMDGFEYDPNKPIFVVAATNYGIDSSSDIGEGLDPALLRRFDNRIYVDLPKEKEREKYINLMLKKAGITTVASNAIHNVAQRTTGQSLAILKNILNLAVRNANRDGIKLNGDILLNAFEEYMYGEKREWSEEYYNMVAIHEAGHAYISYLSGEKPSFVTIVSRGNFGGYMQHENKENQPSYTRDEMLWRIRVALAGRVAETVFFGEKGINTGIGSDIRNATNIASQFIYTYAMSNSLACIPNSTVLASPVGAEIISRIDDLLETEMKNTEALVTKGKKHIKKLADFLRKNNQATEQDILAVFEKAK